MNRKKRKPAGEKSDPRPRCRAISRKTGRQCRNPAEPGSAYCYAHGPEAAETRAEAVHNPDKQPNAGTAGDKPRRRGGQKGNRNAVKHGAYSVTLLPEEQAIYERKRGEFLAQLGEVDVFDLQIVHVLSIVTAKLDVAAERGAPAEALIPISNEILKLLRSLKETRDSRDARLEDLPKTAADFLRELIEQDGERGVRVRQEAMQARIFELECEVNDLRKRLGRTPREDICHGERGCPHCRKPTRQRRTQEGAWICMSCGWVHADPEANENPEVKPSTESEPSETMEATGHAAE